MSKILKECSNCGCEYSQDEARCPECHSIDFDWIELEESEEDIENEIADEVFRFSTMEDVN